MNYSAEVYGACYKNPGFTDVYFNIYILKFA